jgi:hypothetical protein
MPPEPTAHPAVVRRQARDRGPALLMSNDLLRDLRRPFATTADIEQIFREAQRIARAP